MQKKITFCFVFIFILSARAWAQPLYQADLTIPVDIFGVPVKLAWAGGLNTPIFSEIDLNKDGIQDLFVFDKDGFRISTYINNGTPGQFDYSYAPQYISKFPYLHDWAFLVDFDCDSNPDIFTYSYQGGIMIYHNDYTTANGLSFSLYDSLLHTQYNQFFNSNIFVSAVNLPAIRDIDGDGDVDVLTISNSGNFVEFHRNSAIQNLGTCGIDSFFLDPVMCWGHFGLSPFSNSALLNVCKPAPLTDRKANPVLHPYSYLEELRSIHSGSCLTAVNWNGDSLVDLVNGDILGNNLLYIENGGTPDSALMVSSDSLFPSYNDAVMLVTFPHAHYFDVDNDNARDLVVAPCTPNFSENTSNVWYFKNYGTTDSADFVHLKNTLFTDEMIEVGSGANACFFDADGDGLQDILLGTNGYFSPFGFYTSRLAYFRNTGTATTPAFQMITSDYASLESYYFNAIYTCFGDLDGDQDDDMLVGQEDGTLAYFENNPTGTVAAFSFSAPNYQNVDAGNYAAPQLFDVNQDGLNDLLIGNQAGRIFYYENTGTLSNPVFTLITDTFGGIDVLLYPNNPNNGFSVPQMTDSAGTLRLLVGSARGSIFYYDSINNNLTGNFHLVDSNYGGINERARVTIALTDINGDGETDILTGNLAGGATFYLHSPPSGVGTGELPAFSLGIYPNPAHDKITVSINGNNNGKYRIGLYNLQGKLINEYSCLTGKSEIPTGNINSGVYFLKVVDEENTVVNKKIIVQHIR